MSFSSPKSSPHTNPLGSKPIIPNHIKLINHQYCAMRNRSVPFQRLNASALRFTQPALRLHNNRIEPMAISSRPPTAIPLALVRDQINPLLNIVKHCSLMGFGPTLDLTQLASEPRSPSLGTNTGTTNPNMDTNDVFTNFQIVNPHIGSNLSSCIVAQTENSQIASLLRDLTFAAHYPPQPQLEISNSVYLDVDDGDLKPAQRVPTQPAAPIPFPLFNPTFSFTPTQNEAFNTLLATYLAPQIDPTSRPTFPEPLEIIPSVPLIFDTFRYSQLPRGYEPFYTAQRAPIDHIIDIYKDWGDFSHSALPLQVRPQDESGLTGESTSPQDHQNRGPAPFKSKTTPSQLLPRILQLIHPCFHCFADAPCLFSISGPCPTDCTSPVASTNINEFVESILPLARSQCFTKALSVAVTGNNDEVVQLRAETNARAPRSNCRTRTEEESQLHRLLSPQTNNSNLFSTLLLLSDSLHRPALLLNNNIGPESNLIQVELEQNAIAVANFIRDINAGFIRKVTADTSARPALISLRNFPLPSKLFDRLTRTKHGKIIDALSYPYGSTPISLDQDPSEDEQPPLTRPVPVPPQVVLSKQRCLLAGMQLSLAQEGSMRSNSTRGFSNQTKRSRPTKYPPQFLTDHEFPPFEIFTLDLIVPDHAQLRLAMKKQFGIDESRASCSQRSQDGSPIASREGIFLVPNHNSSHFDDYSGLIHHLKPITLSDQNSWRSSGVSNLPLRVGDPRGEKNETPWAQLASAALRDDLWKISSGSKDRGTLVKYRDLPNPLDDLSHCQYVSPSKPRQVGMTVPQHVLAPPLERKGDLVPQSPQSPHFLGNASNTDPGDGFAPNDFAAADLSQRTIISVSLDDLNNSFISRYSNKETPTNQLLSYTAVSSRGAGAPENIADNTSADFVVHLFKGYNLAKILNLDPQSLKTIDIPTTDAIINSLEFGAISTLLDDRLPPLSHISFITARYRQQQHERLSQIPRPAITPLYSQLTVPQEFRIGPVSFPFFPPKKSKRTLTTSNQGSLANINPNYGVLEGPNHITLDLILNFQINQLPPSQTPEPIFPAILPKDHHLEGTSIIAEAQFNQSTQFWSLSAQCPFLSATALILTETAPLFSQLGFFPQSPNDISQRTQTLLYGLEVAGQNAQDILPHLRQLYQLEILAALFMIIFDNDWQTFDHLTQHRNSHHGGLSCFNGLLQARGSDQQPCPTNNRCSFSANIQIDLQPRPQLLSDQHSANRRQCPICSLSATVPSTKTPQQSTVRTSSPFGAKKFARHQQFQPPVNEVPAPCHCVQRALKTTLDNTLSLLEPIATMRQGLEALLSPYAASDSEIQAIGLSDQYESTISFVEHFWSKQRLLPSPVSFPSLRDSLEYDTQHAALLHHLITTYRLYSTSKICALLQSNCCCSCFEQHNQAAPEDLAMLNEAIVCTNLNDLMPILNQLPIPSTLNNGTLSIENPPQSIPLPSAHPNLNYNNKFQQFQLQKKHRFNQPGNYQSDHANHRQNQQTLQPPLAMGNQHQGSIKEVQPTPALLTAFVSQLAPTAFRYRCLHLLFILPEIPAMGQSADCFSQQFMAEYHTFQETLLKLLTLHFPIEVSITVLPRQYIVPKINQILEMNGYYPLIDEAAIMTNFLQGDPTAPHRHCDIPSTLRNHLQAPAMLCPVLTNNHLSAGNHAFINPSLLTMSTFGSTNGTESQSLTEFFTFLSGNPVLRETFSGQNLLMALGEENDPANDTEFNEAEI